MWNEGRGAEVGDGDEMSLSEEKRKGKGESSWILLSSYSFSSDSAAAAVRNCRSLSFGSPISFFLLSFGRLEKETV